MYNKDVLPVVNYLQHYSLEKLTEEHGIKVKDYDQFVVLNYDQIECKKTDPRWWDCRGLILEKDTWKVLSRPFTRFFNFNETFESTSFPFERSIAYDKIDGSLMSAFFNPFDERWEVGTRQMAFGEGTTAMGTSFRQLFLDGGFNGEEIDFQGAMCRLNINFPGYTWIFEMTSPETRVVTPYTEKNIWFLAARHNLTGQYLMAGAIKEIIEMYIPSCKFPKEYTFNSAEECAKAAADLPALEEGYVMYDPVTQNRIKLKSPQYMYVHHLRNNGQLVPKNIMNLVRINEYDEYLSLFKEDEIYFVPYINGFEKLKIDIIKEYNNIKFIEDQKSFALKAIQTNFSGILFSLRKGLNLNDVLISIHIEKLLQFVEYYF